MESSKNLSKPKIFVRYPPGGSGLFVSMVVLNLQHSIPMTSDWHGHNQEAVINQGHTFGLQNRDSQFVQHTVFGQDTEQAVAWLRQNYEFQDTDRNLWVVPTHGGIDMIQRAWPDAKFINIAYTDADIDQMCYSWVSKLNTMPWRRDRVLQGHLEENLHNIRQRYNRLLWLDNIDLGDPRLVTYILKFGWFDYLTALRKGSPTAHTDTVLNLNFGDIASTKLVDQLPNVIDFIGLDVTDDHYNNTVDLIKRYAGAQQPVPWDLPLELYH